MSDNYTLPSVINSCANLLDFETAKLVHDHVLEVDFGSDLYICNALIDMYSRLNNLDRTLFFNNPRGFHTCSHNIKFSQMLMGFLIWKTMKRR